MHGAQIALSMDPKVSIVLTVLCAVASATERTLPSTLKPKLISVELGGVDHNIVVSMVENSDIYEQEQTAARICEVKLDQQACQQQLTKSMQGMQMQLYIDALALLDKYLVSKGHAAEFTYSKTLTFLNTLEQKQKIINALVRSNAHRTVRVCEIGPNTGHTAFFWLLSSHRVSVVSFDPGIRVSTNASAAFLQSHFPGRFSLIQGNTADTLPWYRSRMTVDECDLFFIEGAHEFKTAAVDLANALAVSAKGAPMIMTNFGAEGAQKVWDVACKAGYLTEAELIDYDFRPCSSDNSVNLSRFEECNATKRLELKVTQGIRTGKDIRQKYLSPGEHVPYKVYMNEADTYICIPFNKSDEEVKPIVTAFFKKHGFVEALLDSATNKVVLDVRKYVSGYPLLAQQLSDALDTDMVRLQGDFVGCPDPSYSEKDEFPVRTTFAVAAQFLNEAAIMKEWVEHYLSEGAGHFYLINNGSDDAFLEILSPYIQRGLVTLFSNPAKQTQVANLNRFVLPFVRHHEFMVALDFDEFVYARNDFDTIAAYLESLSPCVDAIVLPQKIFGMNGHTKQPASVIHGNLMRGDVTGAGQKEVDVDASEVVGRLENIKEIVRSASLDKFSLHRHRLKSSLAGSLYVIHPNGVKELPETRRFNFLKGYESPERQWHLDPSTIPDDTVRSSNIEMDKGYISGCVTWVEMGVLQGHYLHLNHYVLQSKEFLKKKLSRGDAFQNYQRKLEHMEAMDRTCVVFDDELSQKKIALEREAA